MEQSLYQRAISGRTSCRIKPGGSSRIRIYRIRRPLVQPVHVLGPQLLVASPLACWYPWTSSTPPASSDPTPCLPRRRSNGRVRRHTPLYGVGHINGRHTRYFRSFGLEQQKGAETENCGRRCCHGRRHGGVASERQRVADDQGWKKSFGFKLAHFSSWYN